MKQHPAQALWTIAELASRVRQALAVDFPGVPSGRVQDRPDLRAIRYYTTLGLLDRPAEMRGRTALYSQRHLWQLVAIKRLQATGCTLAQVQQRLLGIGDRELQRIAAVKSTVTGTPPNPRQSAEQQTPASRQENFWEAVPARPEPADRASAPAPRLVVLVPLGTQIYVQIADDRELTSADVEALQRAAKPLRQLLIERRFVRPERSDHE